MAVKQIERTLLWPSEEAINAGWGLGLQWPGEMVHEMTVENSGKEVAQFLVLNTKYSPPSYQLKTWQKAFLTPTPPEGWSDGKE